jgi:mannose-6-phosphate isomerase-like protein (cupin superfamily)
VSPPQVVALADKLASFADVWNPRIVGHYNGNEIRVAKLAGEFSWHSHVATDELFLVVAGELRIEFRDGSRTLRPGELLVVPAGIEHKPVGIGGCEVVVLDREGEPNTGANPSTFTRTELERI